MNQNIEQMTHALESRITLRIMDVYTSVRLGVMEIRECLVLTEEWQVGSPN